MSDIINRDPWKNFMSFPRFFDELDVASSSQRGLRIHETDKDIVLDAVIAGVPPKDVDVHIEDGVITIKAEKSQEKDSNTLFSYQYYYTTALSGGQWDKAEAEIEDGVITITIPKTKAAQPRKIKVKTKSK